MMEAVGKFLVSISAAALICSVFRNVCEKIGASGKIVKLITSIFMLIAIISPIKYFSFADIFNFTKEIEVDAQRYIEQGQEIMHKQLQAYITEQTGSYILEKASTLGLSVEVSIELTDTQIPKPTAVQISGQISPYAKNVLSSWIEEELGIPGESQTWRY